MEPMAGTFCLRAPITLGRYGHVAKAVVLEPPGLVSVAALIRHKAKTCSDPFLIVHPYH